MSRIGCGCASMLVSCTSLVHGVTPHMHLDGLQLSVLCSYMRIAGNVMEGDSSSGAGDVHHHRYPQLESRGTSHARGVSAGMLAVAASSQAAVTALTTPLASAGMFAELQKQRRYAARVGPEAVGPRDAGDSHLRGRSPCQGPPPESPHTHTT